MRNHILLLGILIAGVVCWQWRSAGIDAAAAAEKTAAESSGANAPLKTIDLVTANLLHEKLESVCRAQTEGMILVHYSGRLGWPAGALGLKREYTPEQRLRWSVGFYNTWGGEGPPDELEILLFELDVSRERQADTIVCCTINGEQLYVQAEAGSVSRLDKPVKELSGMTVRQCVERAFERADEVNDAVAAREKPAAENNRTDVSAKTIDLATANQLHEKFESVCRTKAEGIIQVQYSGPLARPAGLPGQRIADPSPPDECLRWSVALYKSWPSDGLLQELAIQLCELNVSRERQPDTIVVCTINGEQLYIQAKVSDDAGFDEPIKELSGKTIRQVVETAFAKPEAPED